MSLKVTIKTPGLDRMRKAVANNPRLSSSIAGAWSIIYRSFVRLRFLRLSRGGGGEWPPLKPATIKRRRGSGEGAAILRDTGALFASLQPSAGTGGLIQQTPRPLGFTAFLGGSQTYKSGPTLTQVATWQHTGAGRLPKREILVQPDAHTVDHMGQVGLKILTDELNSQG